MNKPRDPVDSWLETDVELLHPAPDTFKRISRRAHRRKTVQAVVTVAGAAVIIAGLVAAPNLASFLPGKSNTSSSIVGASGRNRPVHQHQTGSSPAVRPSQFSLAKPGPALPGTPGKPASAHFRPTSVTFVGQHTGAALGQAGPPCAAGHCTAIAGTASYGRAWYDVGAPPAGPPGSSAGVSQLRFLNLADGWAFGPSLWYTTNGGRTWQPSSLPAAVPGARVTDVEALNGTAYALVSTCAAHCASFTLYRSAAGTDSWRVVGGAGQLAWQQPQAAASFVLAGGSTAQPAASGYLVTPARAVLSGSLASMNWRTIAMAPCAPVPAASQASGTPGHALIASPGTGSLYLICRSPTGAPRPGVLVYAWTAAQGWHQAGQVAGVLDPTTLAAQPNGALLLATGSGILASADGGASWTLVHGGPAGAAAGRTGFSYVGMTTPALGVAVPADSGLGEIFVTTDGGRTWQPSRI